MKEKKGLPKKDDDYLGFVYVKDFNYDRKLYTNLYLYLYGLIIKDYRNRKKKITFVFEDSTTVKMQLRTAIGNLILWKPYCDYNKTITIDKLFDTKQFSETTLANKFDEVIDEFRDVLPIEELCKCIRHMIESFITLSKNFCYIQGNTINLRDVIDMANDSKEFDAILHTKYPDNMRIEDIEKDIVEQNNRAKDIIEANKKNALRPHLKAGGNVNMGQMSQCFVSIGPRSDIYGNISPLIVNTNFIMGLQTVADYYLESFSSRKSLIANRYQMSDSGYTSRQMDLLSIDASLDDNIEDCGTTKTINMFIPDVKTLNMLEFKYIEDGVDKDGKPTYRTINPKKDMNLIGTTVKMRSHTVCELPEGHYCKKCYGKMSYVMKGYHSNLIASHSLSEPIGQTVLSTKHLTKTRTKVVEWPDSIKKYFRCETDALYIKPEYCRQGVEIGIYSDDIDEYLATLESASDDSDDENEQSKSDMLLDYVTRFAMIIDGNIEYFDGFETELYVNSDFLSKIKDTSKCDDGIMFVSLANQQEDQQIFDITIENMEIGVFLKRIMTILGIKSKSYKYTTIENILSTLIASVIEIGISINVCHIESLIYNMIRDKNFIIYRPNFKNGSSELPEYEIVPTCTAITYSRSLSTSLAFERIAAQFKNVYTYYKNTEGFLDPFFK